MNDIDMKQLLDKIEDGIQASKQTAVQSVNAAKEASSYAREASEIAISQRAEVQARLKNIEGEIQHIRERCEARCESYMSQIVGAKLDIATHKGIIWTVSCVISAIVAFTTAWIKSKI